MLLTTDHRCPKTTLNQINLKWFGQIWALAEIWSIWVDGPQHSQHTLVTVPLSLVLLTKL